MAETMTTRPSTPPDTAPTDTRPFAPFEWMLARRYLRARRKEGFISVIAGFSFLGIMLGVATLIIVMAVMNGFRKELFDKILGLNGHVVVHKVGAPFDDYEDITKRIGTVPGVRHAFPLIEGQVMVSSQAQAVGGLVRGLREADILKLEFVSGRVRDGSFDGFDTAETSIALGMRMANALRVSVGDSLTLVSPRGKQTPFGTAPNIKRYKIAAIFELGMSEYDRTIIFMPLAEAQRYFNLAGQASVLEVILDDAEKVDVLRGAMQAAAGDTVHFVDWRERNASFFTVLEVERNVMFVILSLIVLVAALNIISGLMMLVKDKGRDIAILRTMGATKGAIMRVFLITGASIGIVGTLAGLVLGLLFCLNIESVRQFVQWITNTKVFDPSVYYLSTMPAQLDVRETATIVAMAMALSVIATLYPSWRASRLDPVDALRYE
jgi:lipoprotein-releasing system permease protein